MGGFTAVGPQAGPSAGRGSSSSGGGGAPAQNFSDGNYDSFAGYSAPLFATNMHDKEDMEADRIYQEVDERLANGRKSKRRREEEAAAAAQAAEGANQGITTGFSDLKEKLGSVSAAEWDAIPDGSDHTLKYKQPRRHEQYSQMPDALPGGGVLGALSAMAAEEPPPSATGNASMLTGMASARGTVLGHKLDKMGDDVGGQTVVDPKGYLTSLSSQKLNTSAEIGDIKKARALLESVTTTNPTHGPGWIAAARLEEHAGRIPQARKVIRKGTEACPDGEDVWLEALRLNNKENSKVLAADALRRLPNNVKLWLAAADLEALDAQKKTVLRRALEFVPTSVAVWKAAIELENTDDARIMLARAVECIPDATDMWIGLAKLETYENARRVLNKARSANPTDHRIWLTAAKLEEAQNKLDLVEKIVSRAVTSLAQLHVNMDRSKWLEEARAAEAEGCAGTCAAIVRATAEMGVDEEDYERTWLHDAEQCVKTSRPSVETARAIYAYAVTVSDLADSPELWMAAAQLEREFGSAASLVAMLEKAVAACPDMEVFWLMVAKEMWRTGNITGARDVLQRAIDANPDSESVLLAGVKFEMENGQVKEARALAAQARVKAPSGRVWLKSALLEREAKQYKEALRLVDEGLHKFPLEHKLHMMGAQLCQGPLKQLEEARGRYRTGVQACKDSWVLWTLAVQLEQDMYGAAKARSVLDKARTALPTNEYVLREASRLERRAGVKTGDAPVGTVNTVADSLLSAALQKQPASPVLWAEYVSYAPKPQQKMRSVDALKRCDSSPLVITAVAQLFLRDGKFDKARKWLSRAVALDPDSGDSWITLYAAELEDIRLNKKPAATAEAVLARCVAAEPKHGEMWCSFSKAPLALGGVPLGPAAILKKGAQAVLSRA
jgi:pre-mRNA-processing factor 6